MKNYTIRDGFDKMDFEKVTDMLGKVWWSPGISKAEVMQGSKNSAMIVGVFGENNEQIGFSRAVSDKTRFAYIMDVVVDERYRRIGLGKAMIEYMLNHREMKDVYQWCLLTKDAHGVYSKLGFKPISAPERWMEIRKDRPER